MSSARLFRPYGVVTRKGGESSNYARLRHGCYKNVDCHTIITWPTWQLYAYENFTAGERALAGPTLVPPLKLIWGVVAERSERPSTWGGTSQNLGRNDRVWGGSEADRPGADQPVPPVSTLAHKRLRY